MKRLVSGLIAAFVVSAGLVAFSGGTASASCHSTRYVPCEHALIGVAHAKTVKKNAKPRAVITLRTRGNLKVKGVLTITIKGPGLSRKYTLAYNGRPKSFVGPKLKKKGTYTVSIVFKGTNIGDSKASYKIRVRKK